MKTTGITMVRNEADIIEQTIRHNAWHCDELIVLDNGSTDGTREILESLTSELPIPLWIVDDPEIGYYQAQKMTSLAELAYIRREDGPLWIMPFDADELWNVGSDPSLRIADFLAEQDCDVARAALFDYRATAIDPPGNNPLATIQWCTREPATLPKVAFQWRDGAQIHQGNHGVTLPGDAVVCDLLRVNHFPYRSADQFVRKAIQGAAAYAATDLPEDMGAHWRAYGRLYDTYGHETLAGVFRQYFWALSPTDFGLVHQPATYHGGDW